MMVSTEYGEQASATNGSGAPGTPAWCLGHFGEVWTLLRVAHHGQEFFRDGCERRWYKYHQLDWYEEGEAVRVRDAHGGPNRQQQLYRRQIEQAVQRLAPIIFNGVRDKVTKKSALGIAQAWNVDHLDSEQRGANHETMRQLVGLLFQYPELVVEVHGATTTPSACDADLAKHFELSPQTQMAEVMDLLAAARADATLDALVKLGVPRARLQRSHQGCSSEQSASFIAHVNLDTMLVTRPSDPNASNGAAGLLALPPPGGALGPYGAVRAPPTLGAAADDETERIFRTFDADGDGSISVAELRTALNALGLQADTAEAVQVLARYDSDHSGRLERGEFARLVGELRTFTAGRAIEMRRIFDDFDRNRSGAIDHAELRRALNALGLKTDSREAAQVLRRFDSDASGELEFDEFQRLVRELFAYQREQISAADKQPQDGENGENVEPRNADGPNADVRSIFDRFDADRNHSIDVRELRNALTALGVPADSTQAAEVLAKYDRDASGRLEYGEFRALVVELRQYLATEHSVASQLPPIANPPRAPPIPGRGVRRQLLSSRDGRTRSVVTLDVL